MENNKPRLTIGLLLISTGAYDQFLQPLIESVDTHFFPDHEIIIYLFGDKEYYKLKLPNRISLIVTHIKHEPWPASTIFRYRHFVSAWNKIKMCDYVFYSDVDMMITGDVSDDVLLENGEAVDLIFTRHPGFWNNKEWGSQGVSERSKAYLREDERHRYVCGGFNGGKTHRFMEMSRVLADNIDADESIGYRCPHNDETHTNAFANRIVYKDYPTWKVKDLSPAFCMLPGQEARIQFGLTDLYPIIIALDKNHEELRKH